MARLLADRISALLTVTSALSRARERERAAAIRLDALEGDRERLTSALTGGGARHRVNAERLAARVRGAAYAPASRLTLDALERSGQTGAGLALVTPPGVDAVGWAAHAHLASVRGFGPFVVVDATQPGERTPERWNDPDHSPSRLVDGGTLVVLDVDAMPLEVQELVLATLNARTRTEDSALPPAGLIVTTHASPATLTTLGTIAPALRRLLEREIALPALAERGEDLRALVLDGLARVSLRVGREPLGVDASALRLLVDHTWPGNELELEGVLLRAARVARGALVTPDDLGMAGFDSRPPPRPEPTPAAPVTRRRAPRRFARGR
jgi:transcriptional regulator of acetoin/glycerol metabolism